MPAYALPGLTVMAISQAAMLLRIEPFWSWHTPIAWTGYILFVDGIVFARRGTSWLMTSRSEFWFLALASIPLWLVFEAYNLRIRNWHYVNLPSNVVAHYTSEAWAFSTIWPAIFETAELVSTFRGARPSSLAPRPSSLVPLISIPLGAALLLWPIVWPSNYLAPAVWLGFIFLLDPVNDALGDESLLADLRSGAGLSRLVNLSVAGLVCGIVWEFWNYWARAKWIYTVPFMPRAKIFEMPLPGYFGFPPFALECFTMYVLVRHFLWRGGNRPIGTVKTDD
jgi:hypothetical protein